MCAVSISPVSESSWAQETYCSPSCLSADHYGPVTSNKSRKELGEGNRWVIAKSAQDEEG